MDASLLLSMMQPPKLEGLKRILCVQPHPDDNEIGMGGIISKLASEGVQVDYLTVTDGALGDLGLTDGSQPLPLVRKGEAESAGKHLGVSSFLCLGKRDGTLSDVPSLAREIGEILRRGRYDAVASPDPWSLYEAHFDHVVVGRSVAQAAISVNLREYPEGTDTEPLDLKAVLFYFTQRPNTTVDVTPYFQRKMEAVAIHQSQITPEMLQLYTGYFAFRGQRMSGDQRIMEGLKVLSPLHLHCIPEVLDI